MTTEHPVPPLVPGLRAALAVTLGVGVVAAAAALLTGGRPQLLGVGLGAVLVIGFFVFGTMTTGVVAAFAPRASLLVALLTYTLQVVLLAVVLVAVEGSDAAASDLDVGWLAGTVVAGTLGWTAALVVDTMRRSYEPESAGEVHR